LKKGKLYEDKACQHLTLQGFKILLRNWRSPFGEIDIVAVKEKTLWVVEVKGSKKGIPSQRVDCSKVRKIYLTYLSLLEIYPSLEGWETRFLTLSVEGDRVEETPIVLEDCISDP
jgi:putative endonuclease